MRATRDQARQTKHELLKLLAAQLTLLCEQMPGSASFAELRTQIDDLVTAGPNGTWTDSLTVAGLWMSIRDNQEALDTDATLAHRLDVRRRLRAMAGPALESLEAADEKKLASVVFRNRVRNEAEYFLVRSVIDRLEGAVPRDEERLALMYRLADDAQME